MSVPDPLRMRCLRAHCMHAVQVHQFTAHGLGARGTAIVCSLPAVMCELIYFKNPTCTRKCLTQSLSGALCIMLNFHALTCPVNGEHAGCCACSACDMAFTTYIQRRYVKLAHSHDALLLRECENVRTGSCDLTYHVKVSCIPACLRPMLQSTKSSLFKHAINPTKSDSLSHSSCKHRLCCSCSISEQ